MNLYIIAIAVPVIIGLFTLAGFKAIANALKPRYTAAPAPSIVPVLPYVAQTGYRIKTVGERGAKEIAAMQLANMKMED